LIEGRQHLIADLTVVCYVEWHIAYLFFAAIGAAIYAVGIPIAVAATVALHSPIYRAENDTVQCRCCTRRDPAEYITVKMRSRFAFLYNGYSTTRSGVVVAWEALVMVRKLAVVLAGSLLRDPYLQILAALLVLVVSALATAFVQPYETGWLNALDTLGLFALIVTQILSIVYFYTESAEYPFMDPAHLEAIVTILLLLLNGAVILLITALYIVELLGLRAKWTARSRARLTVATPVACSAAVRARAAGEADDPTQMWRHPSGFAVSGAPIKFGAVNAWVYCDDEQRMAISSGEPELLLQQAKGAALAPGETFRTMHKATRKLSDKLTQLNDNVGGCGSANAVDDDAPDVAGVAIGENPGIELLQRIQGADAGSDTGGSGDDAGDGRGDGVDVDGEGVAGVAADVEAWYYYDDDDETVRHGPFSLNKLKAWCDEEHFSHAMEVHSSSGEAVTLGTAFHSAGLLDDGV
jgi:hypothetical protein